MGAASKKQTTDDDNASDAVQPIWQALIIQWWKGDLISLDPPTSVIRATYVPFVAGMAGEVEPESFFDLSVRGKE